MLSVPCWLLLHSKVNQLHGRVSAWFEFPSYLVYRIFFSYCADGHPGGFQVRAIEVELQCALAAYAFRMTFSLGVHPGVELLGHMAVPRLVFKGPP